MRSDADDAAMAIERCQSRTLQLASSIL